MRWEEEERTLERGREGNDVVLCLLTGHHRKGKKTTLHFHDSICLPVKSLSAVVSFSLQHVGIIYETKTLHSNLYVKLLNGKMEAGLLV